MRVFKNGMFSLTGLNLMKHLMKQLCMITLTFEINKEEYLLDAFCT